MNVLDWYWVSWNIVVVTILILVDLIVVQAVLKMLSEIASVENIPDFIEGVKNRSENHRYQHTFYPYTSMYLLHG